MCFCMFGRVTIWPSTGMSPLVTTPRGGDLHPRGSATLNGLVAASRTASMMVVGRRGSGPIERITQGSVAIALAGRYAGGEADEQRLRVVG